MERTEFTSAFYARTEAAEVERLLALVPDESLRSRLGQAVDVFAEEMYAARSWNDSVD